jgi:hypothetical protein
MCSWELLILEIWGSFNCDYEEYCLLKRDAVLSGSNLPNFRKNLLRSLGFRMGALVLLKRLSVSLRLQDVLFFKPERAQISKKKKNVGASSKFWATEGKHEESSLQSTHKYEY